MATRLFSTKWKPTCDIVFNDVGRATYPKCFCENSVANGGVCKWRYDQTCYRSRYQIYLPPYTMTDVYYLREDGSSASKFWRTTNN